MGIKIIMAIVFTLGALFIAACLLDWIKSDTEG